jgi:hypothetical protein
MAIISYYEDLARRKGFAAIPRGTQNANRRSASNGSMIPIKKVQQWSQQSL